MKIFAVIAVLTLVLITVSVSTAAVPSRCQVGKIRGFAHVRGDPRIGTGSIPSVFTGEQRWFEIKYNCSRQNVLTRRVDEGVYDVWFPGNSSKIAVVSAVTGQGAAASVYRIDKGMFRVSIR